MAIKSSLSKTKLGIILFAASIAVAAVAYYAGFEKSETAGYVRMKYDQCRDAECECGHKNKKGEDNHPRWIRKEDLIEEEIWFIYESNSCCNKCRVNAPPIPAEYFVDRGVLFDPHMSLPPDSYSYPSEYMFW